MMLHILGICLSTRDAMAAVNRANLRKKYSITWGKGGRGEKKSQPPDYAPMGSTVLGQEKTKNIKNKNKTTPQHIDTT